MMSNKDAEFWLLGMLAALKFGLGFSTGSEKLLKSGVSPMS
jgi:hypothetical protein